MMILHVDAATVVEGIRSHGRAKDRAGYELVVHAMRFAEQTGGRERYAALCDGDEDVMRDLDEWLEMNPLEVRTWEKAEDLRPIPLADAARKVGMTPRALQIAAAKGHLKAWRPGGWWYTSMADVEDYLRYRWHPSRRLRMVKEDLLGDCLKRPGP